MRALRPRHRLIALAAVGLTAGCGGGQTFTASEFVERINEQGVSIELGRHLSSGGSAESLGQ
jgi:hypothetical protein